MSSASTKDTTLPRLVCERPRSWWRRLPLRMSVRTLMIVVFLLGGGLGWVVHLANVQRDAIAAIRSGGGDTTYNWQRAMTALSHLNLLQTRVDDLSPIGHLKSARPVAYASSTISNPQRTMASI
jgi:hypothetical protein